VEVSKKLDRAFFAVCSVSMTPTRHAKRSQWGAGSRECIGKHLAMMEMSRAVAFLVQRYDFEINESDVTWKNFQFTQFSQMLSQVRTRAA
jgi:cytochrome P450